MVTSNIIEAMVSVQRLSAFFGADELQPDVRKVIEMARLEHGDVVVSVTDGEFSWDKNAVSSTLEGINLTVRKGDLVGILGRVGAGKVGTGTLIRRAWLKTDGLPDEFALGHYWRDEAHRWRGEGVWHDFLRPTESLVGIRSHIIQRITLPSILGS